MLDLPRYPRFVDFEDRAFTTEELAQLAASPSLVRLSFKDCALDDEEVRVLCHLPKLESLWLEGTRVTDLALAEIAKLPKLKWLILDRTAITGSGFVAFAGNKTLRTLWISETQVSDAEIGHLVQVDSLSILVLKKTAITTMGLAALAAHPTIGISAGGLFTPEELLDFATVQRRKANRTRPEFVPTEEDAAAARAVLLSFFEAFTAWERAVAKAQQGRSKNDWKHEQLSAVIEKHCTPKARKFGSPDAKSYSNPPTYEGLKLIDTEWLSRTKGVFYAIDYRDAQERFVVVKQKGRWLLDHKETLLDGWSRAYL